MVGQTADKVGEVIQSPHDTMQEVGICVAAMPGTEPQSQTVVMADMAVVGGLATAQSWLSVVVVVVLVEATHIAGELYPLLHGEEYAESSKMSSMELLDGVYGEPYGCSPIRTWLSRVEVAGCCRVVNGYREESEQGLLIVGCGMTSLADEVSCCSKKSTSGSTLWGAGLARGGNADWKLGSCGHELWWTKGGTAAGAGADSTEWTGAWLWG